MQSLYCCGVLSRNLQSIGGLRQETLCMPRSFCVKPILTHCAQKVLTKYWGKGGSKEHIKLSCNTAFKSNLIYLVVALMSLHSYLQKVFKHQQLQNSSYIIPRKKMNHLEFLLEGTNKWEAKSSFSPFNSFQKFAYNTWGFQMQCILVHTAGLSYKLIKQFCSIGNYKMGENKPHPNQAVSSRSSKWKETELLSCAICCLLPEWYQRLPSDEFKWQARTS